VDAAAVEAFRLGYAPAGWDGLIRALRSRGFDGAALERAGLAVARSGGDGHYDALRHRLIFPIHDLQGRPVAFGGRALEKVITPYLETQILEQDRHDDNEACVPAEQKPDREIQGRLPTLTVLLNEAAPATDAKQFLSFLKCHAVDYQVNNHEFPLLPSVPSDGDWANHVMLPLGQFAAKLRMKTRTYCPANAPPANCSGDPADPGVIASQSTYYTHTTASIPALYSHEVVKGTQCLNGAPVGSPFLVGNAPYLVCGIRDGWNHTPYWIGVIPVAIVPDHSDIFHRQLYDYLRAIVEDALVMRMAPSLNAK
jgi:hypothetical protein